MLYEVITKHIEAATPMASDHKPIINGKTRADAQINGISAADMSKFGYKVLYGRLLDETDVGTTNFVMSYNTPFFFLPFKEQGQFTEVTKGMELPFDPTGPENKYGFTWDYGYGQGPVSTDKPKVKPINAKCVGILVQSENSMWDNSIYMDVSGLLQLSKKLQEEQKKS